MTLSVAILTVSDTAATDNATDLSGPALNTFLTSLPGSPYTIITSAIVPDEVDEIQMIVKAWCESGIALVLTSGGTGFGVRDRTPEAVAPLIHKPAPGLVAAMLTHSLTITHLAALARPVAGISLCRKDPSGAGTLIITLPGSPKGAVENLQSLLRILPHALELAAGGKGERTHAEMGAGAKIRESAAAGGTLATGAAPAAVAAGVDGGHQHHLRQQI